MKVENMKSANGNSVPNQFIIRGDLIVFQSYESKIAEYNPDTGELYLNGNMWDYSATTRKYFKQFVNQETVHYQYENKSKWEKLIKNNPNIIEV